MLIFHNKKFLHVLLFCFCLIISIPLCSDNLIVTGHDILFHTARIEAIKQGLETGIFPVKLYGVSFNDYGNPVGYFYPDIFLYIPAIFRLMGFDISLSYRLFLFLITLYTAMFSFIGFNKFFKHLNEEQKIKLETPYYLYGFAATVLYTGALYRFTDLYVRSALGEAIAMIFLPFAIINFYLMLKGDKKAWIFVVIGSTGVLSSHLLSALLLFITYVIMSLVFIKRFFSREFLKSLLKSIIFVTLINLWFYAPFVDMYESFDFYIKNNVQFAHTIATHAWDELFRYHFFVGILSIIVLIVYLVFVSKRIINKTVTHLDKVFLVYFLLSVIFVLLMSPIAPWWAFDFIPFLDDKLGVLQFSYRLSMFTCIFISVALSIAICANKRFFIMTFIIPFAVLYWMMNIPHTFPNLMVSIYIEDDITLGDMWPELKDKEFGNILMSSLDLTNNPSFALYTDYIHNDIAESEYKVTFSSASKELWESVRNKTFVTLNPNEITPENAVTNFSRKGLNLDFSTNAKEETEIKLPLWYYPHCYMATCDGKEIPVFEVYHHRLAINAPAGEHNIKVFPKLHAPYRNAVIISVIGLLLFIYVCIKTLAKKEELNE